jgi:predicted N-acetyltransferase YhbS
VTLIRRASLADLSQIVTVIEAAFAQYRDDIPPAIFGRYLVDLRAIGERWDECEIFVAEHEGRVAGSIAFYADASLEGLGLPTQWAGLRSLAVHPAARGLRLGRRLSERCVERAREIAAPAFGLHTAAFMTAARRIYDGLGFRRAPEFDLRASDILGLGADAGDIDVIAYVRDLTGPTSLILRQAQDEASTGSG